MLCLGRKVGEKIVIGEAVVTVLASLNGRVRLGIDAPREIQVSRPDKPAAVVKQ